MAVHVSHAGLGVRREDVRRMMRRAALVAAAFSVYSISLRVLEGPEPFLVAGTSVVRVVVSYWVAAVVVGGIVGVGLPLGRTAIGAGFLGGVAGGAVVVASALAFATPEQWLRAVPAAVLAAGFVAGPLCGLFIWAARRSRATGLDGPRAGTVRSHVASGGSPGLGRQSPSATAGSSSSLRPTRIA